MRATLLAVSALALIAAGCGKNSGTTGNATAKLKFARAARSGPRTTYAASTFKMKLIAAYLTADIDSTTGNNIGNTTMIYLNPQCVQAGVPDIMHCDIDNTAHGGVAEDGNPWTGIVTTFFDFSSTTAANTDLNAQGRAIDAGTYKYARLEFCKYASTAPNIQWASTAAGVTTIAQFQRSNCTVNSAVFSPPIAIAVGGSATITLSYDISAAVDDGGTGSNCAAGTGGNKCFSLPTFTPSATTP